MFFAEVRPFEEIYRPGDGGEGSGQQQQGGAGEEATKLAELQKQIISATWNLQRAENSDGKPSEKYLKDAPVIRDGQADALKQATALAEKAEDPKSRALIDAVTREMQTAHERLVEAAQSPAPLPAALSSEQSAYNALLKLAAHEFQITRSKSSSGKQSASRNQQQLDELEMKDEKKRYETKREAEPQQNEQQREQLAILNRLKELAQRQQDINERLKELQTALQAAKSEPEKEELKRQLKRLREEEQQLLADLDEAKQKMEQSPQQSQLAEERQRLEQTRSEAQKAAESMEKGQPSQALASGTRAQRELQELRDDFRKKTSGQFNEELREMRADARTLAQEQQELAQKLAEPAARERRTLDGSSPREQLAKDFERQQQGLGELREQMRSVSEKAEAAEPLLAKELYDALRKNAQDNTEETLKTAGQLAQRGYGTQAQKFEEKAREEIEEIKTGVERAAESVLGNEAEALRMARAELDALAGQLDREISKARPDLASGEGADAKTPGSTPVPGVGEGVPPSRTSSDAPKSEGAAEGAKPDEVRPGGTPGPTPGTGVLPGTPQPRGEGKSPAQGEGESQQPGQQPGQQQGKQPGQQGQPGQQAGQQPGQQGQPGQQPGQQGGQQPGQPAQGSPQPGKGSGSGAGGDPSGNADPSSTGQQPGSRLSDLARAPRNRDRGGSEGGGSGGGPLDGEQAGPIRGEGYAEWSDRLRNIEEVLDDPALRNEAARIRELARGMRVDFKRHSLEPKWDLVKTTIGAPLAELRNRLTEELARRESKDSLVPIDRDPVPTKYAERVRRYYEDLGRSR